MEFSGVLTDTMERVQPRIAIDLVFPWVGPLRPSWLIGAAAGRTVADKAAVDWPHSQQAKKLTWCFFHFKSTADRVSRYHPVPHHAEDRHHRLYVSLARR
jgi:hypothetical protein